MSWGRHQIPVGFQLSAGFSAVGTIVPEETGESSNGNSTFQPTHFLAQFLDNFLLDATVDEGSGPLAAALRRAPQSRLGDLLQRLPEESRKVLQDSLGAPLLQEMVHLSRESDPELFWEQALHLAQRLEREDKVEAAAALLQGIQVQAGPDSKALSARVDRDLGAILGQGEGGARFEFLLRRFAREATDPWMIAGFGAGSIAFQATRLGVLSRLGGEIGSELLATRPVAGLLASAAGLGAEVPTFVLVTKIGHEIGGKAQDWSGEALAHELSAAGVTLFCLKGAGALSRRALRAAQGMESSLVPLAGQSGVRVLAQAAVPHVGMFTGIVLARKAEEELGLRPIREGETLLTDSLATYFQFQVGGRLAGEVLGPRFQAWQRAIHWKTESLSNNIPRIRAPFSEAWLPATTGPVFRRGSSLSDLMNAPVMSENHGGDGSGKPPSRAPRLRLVRSSKEANSDASPKISKSPTPETPPPAKASAPPEGERQQVLDLSAARMLRSRNMADEKSGQPENDLINTLGSAFDHSGKAGQVDAFRSTWAEQLGYKIDPREILAFQKNLSDLPGYFHALLSYYAVVKPSLAKVVLAKMDILPSRSPLRTDPELRTAMEQKARTIFSPEDLDQHTRGILFSFQKSGKNFFPEKFQALNEAEKLEWHEKIGDLPAVLVEALNSGRLQSANLLLMTHRLGLSRLGTPHYEYLPVED